jgi:hypothetical protein
MHYFHKFILVWNSTCFGQFVCPSSGVYSPYTQQWCMSYRFVDSFRAGPGCYPVWHIPLLSVQWINSWWWTDELSETCRVSWQNKCVKLVHLDGFIAKKFVTMRGHMNVKFSLYTSWGHIGGVEIQIRSFLALALDKEKWSASIPGRFIHGKRAPSPTEYEAEIDTVLTFSKGM